MASANPSGSSRDRGATERAAAKRDKSPAEKPLSPTA